MGLEKIKELLAKAKAKKEEKKHIEEMGRFHERIEVKKLSANERELMKYKEEERQEQLKKMLNKYREKEKKEIWSGQKFNPIHAPNIMKSENNIFKGNKNIFANKSNLFNQPDLFFKK